MYLGFVLMLVGLALLLGSASPFGVAALFALLLDFRFIRAEEAMLNAKFGAAWRAYKARVRRWL
jgi:protein-S-isoprenylcysteine O-methyltransferase Ste14